MKDAVLVHSCGRVGVVYCHQTLSFVYPALQEGGPSPAAFAGHQQEIRCVLEVTHLLGNVRVDHLCWHSADPGFPE